MTKAFPTVLIVLALLLAYPGISQDQPSGNESVQPTGDEGRADKLLADENYKEALQEYLLVLDKKPEDIKINYNIGLCYLYSDFEKHESIRYFEKVVFYDEEAAEVYFMLGKAYQSELEFDRAIDMFNKFIEYYHVGAEFEVEDAETEIEYCENAYELMKFPVKCVYENLGPEINSEYPDYFPYVTIDESFIAYTSKRDDGSLKLPDGTFASNIYYARVENGEYGKGLPMPGATNAPGESEVVIGMSSDGLSMLLLKGEEGVSGDIYEGEFADTILTNISALDPQVNSKYREIAACYGADKNTIYFVSDRPDGFGGTDIWVIKRLPNGRWGVPFNAGPEINTDRDEDFPNLSPDGEYLFFSSKGHFSMGGFDIFKAKWNADSNMFMNPRNIGYPVNSTDDDMNYRLSSSGRYGYISALRPEGYGDYDIYRLTITEVESEYSVLRGTVSSSKEGTEPENISITVSDLKTGEMYGVYAPNPNTRRYVIILPPGEFDVLMTADDHEPVSFEVKILGKSSFQPEILRDIAMPKS